MQLYFIIAGLPFLHEVVACHIAQDALEFLLLRRLAVLAVARSITSHLSKASIGNFGHAVAGVIVLPCPSHITLGGAITQIEVLRQPFAPTTISHLVFGLDQHLTGLSVVLLSGSIALLQLALDQWNKHLERASD